MSMGAGVLYSVYSQNQNSNFNISRFDDYETENIVDDLQSSKACHLIVYF